MKLFVDDIRKCPEGWVLARTNEKAIRFLHNWDVEEISIDHDVCYYNRKHKIIEEVEETFQPVAFYLAVMPVDRRPKKITLHSANPAGAQTMYDILWKAGIESEIKNSAVIKASDILSDYGN